MINYKKQTESGLCGLYNLANALRNESLLMYEDEPDFVPCGNPEINKILRIEGEDIRVQNMITNYHHDIVIPNDYFIQAIDSYVECKEAKTVEHPLIVLLLSVQMGTTEYQLHATTLMICNGKMAYSDPHNDSFEMINSYEHLFTKFKYINSVSTFAMDEGYVIFDADKYGVLDWFK
jgi:hypothetical protein